LPADLDASAVIEFIFSNDAEAITPWQIPAEFGALAALVERRRPTTVLEIGTADGGTLFAHARLASPDALVISIDLPEGPFGGGYPASRVPLYRSFAQHNQRLELLRVDSHEPATVALLETVLAGRRIEYAFIDGDHTYEGVRQDFDLCRRFAAPGAVIAFHDIVDQPNSAYVSATRSQEVADWAVHRFWKELKREYDHDEFIHDPMQEGYGIGVVYLERRSRDRAP